MPITLLNEEEGLSKIKNIMFHEGDALIVLVHFSDIFKQDSGNIPKNSAIFDLIAPLKHTEHTVMFPEKIYHTKRKCVTNNTIEEFRVTHLSELVFGIKTELNKIIYCPVTLVDLFIKVYAITKEYVANNNITIIPYECLNPVLNTHEFCLAATKNNMFNNTISKDGVLFFVDRAKSLNEWVVTQLNKRKE